MGSDPVPSAHFKTVECSGQEFRQHFSIRPIHLSIASWVGNRRVGDRSPNVVAIFLEGLACKLRAVIGGDTVRYPEKVNNSLD
jgi:hypothetical protein